MDPHGPTVTWPYVIRTAPDQGDFPHSLREPGVMAHQEDDITFFLSSQKHRGLPSFYIKSARRLPQDPAGNPPCFYQGNPRDSPRVMILVLHTKSIGQWPFTLINGTLEYLQIEPKRSHGYMWLECDWQIGINTYTCTQISDPLEQVYKQSSIMYNTLINH